MKPLLRLACLAALLPGPALAAGQTTVDVYRELIRYRAATVGAEKAFGYDTHAYVSKFLDNPDSLYSDLRIDPPITNEIWWYDFVDSLPIDATEKSDAALDMLQWQGGFTKARIGIDVVVDKASVRAYRGEYAAASAIKAGVDADIFLKAWDMNGRMTTIGAGHAVALQLLRHQVRSNAPETYDALGIKPGVLSRYLQQNNPEKIDAFDQAYLADLLRYALSRQDFTIDTDGHRQLPAAYRVARVAAAFADAGGYLNPHGYCRGNDPHPDEPTRADAIDDNRPLCFVAATDRAVQSWFRRQMRHEASLIRKAHENRDETATRLMAWFSGALLLIDLAGFVEMGEAGLLGEMSAEGAIPEEEAAYAEERANQLTCRLRS
ncbi:hypothetical protein [Luteibacter sp. dw_328]|uniref:hypothetical protein n=1 Tax=Luteibacter sp. dw_328 TaxID=2719796 RepID=UPI001BD1CC98|nr:hypothetical protein [Luteibacter sp. dw_328]